MTRSVSFAPVAHPDTCLIILGSLPGAASLAAGQYYANPLNQFWKLMGAVLETDLESLDYSARLQQLAQHRIGLWDVVASAHRPGSLDSNIRNHSPNDLNALVGRLTNLRAVAFNGAKGFRLGHALLSDAPIPHLQLPSSSPAHAIPFQQKLRAWMQLKEFVAQV